MLLSLMSLTEVIFRGLEGQWEVERCIDNGARFKGEICFTKMDSNSLSCAERGTFSLGEGEDFLSHRNFIYRLADNKLKIIYDDPYRRGDIMHELDFSTNDRTARHIHQCGDDFYDLSVAVQKETVTMEYIVTGPKKNYRMKSLLSRPGLGQLSRNRVT